MHGLVNRAIQYFVTDTYGHLFWSQTIRSVGCEADGFEAMQGYDDQVTHDILRIACSDLEKSEDDFLEDLGTYLVSHPNTEAVRRLLRFGGETFPEFLLSLNDLRGRARLAMPELELPELHVRFVRDQTFDLHVEGAGGRFSAVWLGALRALADDYGALAVLERLRGVDGHWVVRIRLLDTAFAADRGFSLVAEMASRGKTV